MASGYTKYSSALGVLVLIFAYFYSKSVDDELRNRLDTILGALLKAEQEYVVNPRTKVAIGYGACQDYVVSGKDIMSKYEPPNEAEHFGYIKSEEEMLKVYAYFFKNGAAADRYMSNETLFEELVQFTLTVPNVRSALGGNAPVMATRLAQEGCEVLLAAKLTQQLKASLPSDVTVVGGDITADDVHILLEYQEGENWGKYIAPRANRFVIHSDVNNPTVSSLEEFGQKLTSFSPKVMIVGGLHMMDNFPFAEGKRLERLLKIQEQMAAQPSTTRVHFELASFTEDEFFQEILDYIVPYSDSLGMNEQELANMHSMLVHHNITTVSDAMPRVATALDQMRDVFRVLSQVQNDIGGRRVTRIHLHTLAYQAIMTAKNSPWRNSEAAAAKASLVANRYVCGSDQVDTKKAKLIMDDSFSISKQEGSQRVHFDDMKPISCWEENIVEICIAPVLVCTEVYQTGGGGDNVSSAGLALQI